MGLDQARHDIAPARFLGAGGCEHGVGLADAGRGAEKNLQMPPALFLGQGKQGVRRSSLRYVAGHLGPSKEPIYDFNPSSARLSLSTLTRGSPRRPKVRPSTWPSTRARTRSSGRPRALATRGTWNRGGRRRDVRIEAAAGGGHQIDRDRRRRVLFLERLHIGFDAVSERLAGGAEVRAHGVRGIVGRVDGLGGVLRVRRIGRGRPAMEVFVVGEVAVKGSWLLLFLVTLTFIIGGLGLGLLISTIANTLRVAYMFAGLLTMLPSFLLSGWIFPLRNMPIPIQIVSYIVPARYFPADPARNHRQGRRPFGLLAPVGFPFCVRRGCHHAQYRAAEQADVMNPSVRLVRQVRLVRPARRS